jgi:hypothetical protein
LSSFLASDTLYSTDGYNFRMRTRDRVSSPTQSIIDWREACRTKQTGTTMGRKLRLYHYACMAEMAFGTLQSSTDVVNAPPKECMRPLTGSEHNSLIRPVRTMEGCIVHHKHGFWLRPYPAVLEKLLDKRFEECSISRAFVNTRQNNTILRICCQCLVALAAMTFRYLNWCH